MNGLTAGFIPHYSKELPCTEQETKVLVCLYFTIPKITWWNITTQQHLLILK